MSSGSSGAGSWRPFLLAIDVCHPQLSKLVSFRCVRYVWVVIVLWGMVCWFFVLVVFSSFGG